MTPETLTALKGSIEKWKKIERSTRALDSGYRNCPLCKLFSYGGWHPNCSECPIKKKTKRDNCCGSPYEKWDQHYREVHYNAPNIRRHKDCPTCLDLATRERKFLESLLPKGSKG